MVIVLHPSSNKSRTSRITSSAVVTVIESPHAPTTHTSGPPRNAQQAVSSNLLILFLNCLIIKLLNVFEQNPTYQDQWVEFSQNKAAKSLPTQKL
jgi:hypothetical protein